jgi:hypothetical protein
MLRRDLADLLDGGLRRDHLDNVTRGEVQVDRRAGRAYLAQEPAARALINSNRRRGR